MGRNINNFKTLVAEWMLRDLKNVRKRDINIPTDINKIIAIIGPRRAGKTFLMYYTINRLLNNVPKKNILYINFEDERLKLLNAEDLTDLLTAFYEVAKPAQNKPMYLFLDEIQLVNGWDKWIRRIDESKQFKIYISGSSSKLLSKELSTSLSGRSIDYLVMPFSFKESLVIENGQEVSYFEKIGYTEKKGFILNELREYLVNGGYPEVVLEKSKDVKLKILRSYYDTIFYKDLAEHFSIKNIALLDAFLRNTLSTYSKYFSISKVYATLKNAGYKTSKKTLLNLLNYANQVFFIFPINIISRSEKKRSINPKKIYAVDTGIISAIKIENSIGKLMENCCFIELFRRKDTNNFEISYWKEYGTAEGREVDFVLYDQLKVIQLIQVSYIERKEDINKREISALVLASKELNCNNLLIITWDHESEEKIEGKKIKFIPLWKWLMGVK